MGIWFVSRADQRCDENKWTVEELADGYYRFNNIDDTDLKLILDAFDIEIKRKLYRRGELKSLKTGIKITT